MEAGFNLSKKENILTVWNNIISIAKLRIKTPLVGSVHIFNSMD